MPEGEEGRRPTRFERTVRLLKVMLNFVTRTAPRNLHVGGARRITRSERHARQNGGFVRRRKGRPNNGSKTAGRRAILIAVSDAWETNIANATASHSLDVSNRTDRPSN